MKPLDLIGSRFSRLVVISGSQKVGKRFGYRLCRCDCGKELVVYTTDLRIGHTKSCGCLSRDRTTERNLTHGMGKTRANRIWRAMKSRCSNPRVTNWKYYGGRGVTVCERWQSFENFVADMGQPEPGMTLDRIDNAVGYSPENCRWVTHATQMANTRRNRMITWRGRTQHMSAWAREIGCEPMFLRHWIVA